MLTNVSKSFLFPIHTSWDLPSLQDYVVRDMHALLDRAFNCVNLLTGFLSRVDVILLQQS